MRFDEHGVIQPSPLRRARRAPGVLDQPRSARPRPPLPSPDHERIIDVEAEEVPPLPIALVVAAFIGLFVAGMWAAGLRPSLPHRDSPALAVVYTTPKAATESWLLQQWLPTVLAAPYGASAVCRPIALHASSWACVVRQTRAADALPASEQRTWHLLVVGTADRGFRASAAS